MFSADFNNIVAHVVVQVPGAEVDLGQDTENLDYYLFDNINTPKVATIELNTFVKATDTLRLGVTGLGDDGFVGRDVVLKQPDSEFVGVLGDDSLIEFNLAGFVLDEPIDVYFPTFPVAIDGNPVIIDQPNLEYKLQMSVVDLGSRLGGAIQTNLHTSDSDLSFTYTPVADAVVDTNLAIGDSVKIGEIRVEADPVLQSDLDLSFNAILHNDFVSDEYKFCMSNDSQDGGEVAECFNTIPEGLMRVEHRIDSGDLTIDLLVTRVANPADPDNPFLANDVSFEIRSDSRYKVDGSINVTGFNVTIAPQPQP